MSVDTQLQASEKEIATSTLKPLDARRSACAAVRIAVPSVLDPPGHCSHRRVELPRLSRL